MEIIVLIFLIIYIFSFLNVIFIYIRKSISPDFWAIISAAIPILNTFIAIKYGDGLKEFIEKLNKNK